jgi:hypothetical protein
MPTCAYEDAKDSARNTAKIKERSFMRRECEAGIGKCEAGKVETKN